MKNIVVAENNSDQIETLSRDDIVDIIKNYRSIIVEADEWRPVADHIMKLMEFAYNAGALEMRSRAAESCHPFLRSMVSKNEVCNNILNIDVESLKSK